MEEETSPLLSSSRQPVWKPGHAYKPGHVSLWRVVMVFILLVVPLLLLADLELPEIPWPGSGPIEREFCPQVEPMHPILTRNLRNHAWDVVGSPEFLAQGVDALSGAIKIHTETFDGMEAVGEDPSWAKFDDFHAYLRYSFPLVHEHLNVTTVNTYGLVYEWKGSNLALKPVLLAAHQDTVPVEPTTVDGWTFPPFSGHYDGEWIWGRGSSDDKLSLISILLSIETLLSLNFSPQRSTVLAFGFDEEISGRQGAAKIAVYLEETYGTEGFSILIDEGGGMVDMFGARFASPAVGEKGYMDVRIEVTAPGGHSSVPPANHHTGIGRLSQIIVLLENNTITPRITRNQPIYKSIQCLGEHAPDITHNLKRAIAQSYDSDRALRKVEDILFKNDIMRSVVANTQAVDVIGGGVKSNALPETSWAIINTRIATDSSVSAIKGHYTAVLRDYAINTNITLISFGETVLDRGSLRKIEVSDAWGTALEPAPVSSLDGEAYRLLSGTILATEQAMDNRTMESPVFVMPFIMPGNTDTRYYWNLTKNSIFRYHHLKTGDGLNIHTVDEHVRATAIPSMVRFFINLILNADESRIL